MKTPKPNTAPDAGRTHLRGLLVEFDSPGALVTASERVREAGYTRWDTHTPFPVHGIDEAMGIRRTRLPWVVFGLGVLGCIGGLILQWWTNATGASEFPFVPAFVQGYNYIISGKPQFSLPANIPVIFETTVLLAAFGAVFGMLAMNNLPRHFNPLFSVERFKRVTTDRFFIVVNAVDPKFDAARTRSLLESLGGVAVEAVEEAPSPSRLPQAMVIGGLIVACLAILPPLFVAKARVSKSTKPRLHLVQDMDNQERFKTQQTNPIFADGRARRPAVAGTVARGDWPRDPHLDAGKIGDAWATTYPPTLDIDAAFIRRGQQRFNIYCVPCHGFGGAGNGIVHERATALETPGWVPPSSLLDQVVVGREHGHIFNTITNGIRTMPPYGDQIPPRDRWAIVAYIRALQYSRNVNQEDVPRELWPQKR